MHFTLTLTAFACTPTELEPPSKDSTALIAERPDMSQEIPETSAVTLENVRRDEHSPSRFR
jgi:hypothetical protein